MPANLSLNPGAPSSARSLPDRRPRRQNRRTRRSSCRPRFSRAYCLGLRTAQACLGQHNFADRTFGHVKKLLMSRIESKVGLISDTHGLLRPEALTSLAGADYIIHAGDIGDASILERLSAIAPVIAVRGNNDKGAWASSFPKQKYLRSVPRSSTCSTMSARSILIQRQPVFTQSSLGILIGQASSCGKAFNSSTRAVPALVASNCRYR